MKRACAKTTCGRTLRSDNRNPDNLCGYCQAGNRPKPKKTPIAVATQALNRACYPVEKAIAALPPASFEISVSICAECPLMDAVMDRCQHPSLSRARAVMSIASRPAWCPLLVVPLRIAAKTA